MGEESSLEVHSAFLQFHEVNNSHVKRIKPQASTKLVAPFPWFCILVQLAYILLPFFLHTSSVSLVFGVGLRRRRRR